MTARLRTAGWLSAMAAVVLSFWGATAAAAPRRGPAVRPLEVRVVVVTTWEVEKNGRDLKGELHAWREKWPLNLQMAFPAGVHPLLYDPKTHVLAVLTGMATARAAASIMALGLDPRFDLTHAYWIVAGTAGVDPKAASVGSTAWARFVVDGDLSQELDARDMPSDWPVGVVPYGRKTPYETPAPPAQSAEANVAYRLNPALVDWAFTCTRAIALTDDATLSELRAPYSGPGRRPPFVLKGDGLMSARTWYGYRLNDWAERWVTYWTGAEGVFVMSAEEDTGIMQALSLLNNAGKAALERVLILRAASDYTVGPPGVSGAAFLAKETESGFPANQEALDALYRVASPVVRALSRDWAQTRDHTPKSAPGQAPEGCAGL